MSVLTTIPQLLLPHSRQFPFDEVAEKIVTELYKRNWDVPGIKVEFYDYGSGEAKYRMVSTILGKNFKLHFSRPQGKLDKYHNNIAALSDICIPKQILEVYSDESGPTYYLYVGKNWEADKDWFMNSIKVHAKMNKEPRRYLRYSGNTYKTRATELVASNDLGRDYSPRSYEPTRINLSKKFDEFTKWLTENVLEYIMSFPEAKVLLPFKANIPVPYEGSWETIYSVCEWREADKIALGKKDLTNLSPFDRYVYLSGGRRLVPLSNHSKVSFPKIAHEGFIWCDPNQNITKKSKANELLENVRNQASSFFSTVYLVAINLKYSNDIYVADNSKFDETRFKLFEEIAPRDRLTDEELDEAYAVRGATIVPIKEYQGGYKEPVVLIARELEFSEIEWVKECKR